jgi:hypothetical protein
MNKTKIALNGSNAKYTMTQFMQVRRRFWACGQNVCPTVSSAAR